MESIQEDIRWLGFDWGDNLFHAADYFEKYYQYAVQLVKEGKAYVCDQSEEEIREYRGTVTVPGRPSPYRDRSVEENLDLLERMRAGEFPDGSRTLRAKIDMANPNMKMRDPLIYRIRHATHHRTGDDWCIYPMYDFAHCLGDSIEGITHSICTLEFENNRELYDWFLDELRVECHPQQIEFARLNLNYTVMSKRMLLKLVEGGFVSGWDDPRMPTLSGLRRRGYPPEAIRNFSDRVGVAKANSTVDVALLEHTVREYLNRHALRVFGVLRPLRVVIENYPEDTVEDMPAVNNPEDPAAGERTVPFSRVLYIEQDDFREDPPKKYFRLAPGREVRLRYGYFIKCEDFIKNDAGEVVELRCTYDPETRGGNAPDGRKVKGTIHWVSAAHAVEAEVRLYEHLFDKEDPANTEDGDFYQSAQSQFAGNAHVVQGRARPGGRETGRHDTVRAPGIFLRGFGGFITGKTGVQPHRHAARHVGQNRKENSNKKNSGRYVNDRTGTAGEKQKTVVGRLLLAGGRYHFQARHV